MSFIDFYQYLNFSSGIYFEAGAVDGIEQSNTLSLERDKDWFGILVEPRNLVFQQLVQNRNEKNIFVKKALIPKPLQQPIKINNDGLESRINIIPSYFSKEMEDAFYRNQQMEDVESITLDSLLEEHNITKIDFFSLDIENLEYSILKNYSFKIKPKYILVETWNRDFYQSLIRNLLVEKGYEFKGQASGNDDFFILK
jgi:FkbM family methyltransferase